MQRVEIGRPESTPAQKKFKQNSKKHEMRILLECKVLKTVYLAWAPKQPLAQTTVEDIRKTFQEFGYKREFDLMRQLFAATNIKVSSNDIVNYTCKKDILYVLHKLKDNFESKQPEKVKKVVSAKLLYLVIMYYLFQQNVLTKSACAWMDAHYRLYANVMRTGRDPKPEQPDDYALTELIVRWALEMAKLQDLLIHFD